MTREVSKFRISAEQLLALAVLAIGCQAASGQSLVLPAADAGIKTAGSKIATQPNAEGGWNLSSEGELGDYVQLPASGTYKIIVRAYGSPAKGGWPSMAILVDGRHVATGTVDSKVFADYSFKATMTAGTHRLTVAFLNDMAVPDPSNPKVWLEDRNLYLNRIELQPPPDGKQAILGKAEDWAREAIKAEEKTVKDTDRQIELNRKADAIIEVVDGAGKPVAGAKVAVDLVRHEFLFGCNIYMFDRFKTPGDNDLYRQRFAELFNYATVGFYWKSYEPKQGEPQYAYTDKVVAWCLERGISMKGHPLLWGNEAGIPSWSKGQPDAQTQKQRVTDILHRYKGKIALWEVVNEPAHVPLPKIDEPYGWARQADPKAYLIVNDYHVMADGCPAFFQLLTKAKADGVPFDGVGIQAHEPRTMRFGLDLVKETLDHYATLGKDLHITEFTPTSAGDPITGSAVTGKWDEQAQEDYAVKFYRVCFAHPAVKGITWWDLCDQGSWLPGGGMLRKDLSPKPVYTALKKLIHEEWHTNAQGQANDAGRFAYRGFLGRYDVTITADGKTVKAQFDLRSDAKSDKPTCLVTLPKE